MTGSFLVCKERERERRTVANIKCTESLEGFIKCNGRYVVASYVGLGLGGSSQPDTQSSSSLLTERQVFCY